jgi:hypothetical protein
MNVCGLGLRFAKPYPTDKHGKEVKSKSYGKGGLLNLHRLQNLDAEKGWVVICEGETDMLELQERADQEGVPLLALSPSCGAGQSLRHFAATLKDYRVAVCYDEDVAGRRNAPRRAQEFRATAKGVREVRLPFSPEQLEAGRKDLRDWLGICSGVGSDPRTATDFLELIEETEQSDETTAAAAQATSAASPQKGASQATVLIDLARDRGVELFHDADRVAYARMPVADHRETWRLRSRFFSEWLRREYFMRFGNAIGNQAAADAVSVLSGIAIFEGPKTPVYVRLGQHDDAVFLDLGREDWSAIRVDAKGWEIVKDVPLHFRRPKGIKPLPAPIRGGSVERLRFFLNFASDEDWALFQGCCVYALQPKKPQPITIFGGEPGSAKTTVARVMRRLWDPNKVDLRPPPREERDLAIAAENSMFVALDNLSQIPSWLSDALCRISTGGGFGTRQLYSDGDEMLFDYVRPVILTGIENLATHSDLQDRAVQFVLPKIKDIKDEDRFWPEFERAQPAIMGAMLDAVAVGMARHRDIILPNPPRMADFARFAVAAEPKLDSRDGDFLCAYAEKREAGHEDVLGAWPVAQPLRDIAERRSSWRGQCSELLALLNEVAAERIQKQKRWPKAPNALSGQLRRLAPHLRGVGTDVTYGQEDGSRSKKWVEIKKRASGDDHCAGPASQDEGRENPRAGRDCDDASACVDLSGPLLSDGENRPERGTGDPVA